MSKLKKKFKYDQNEGLMLEIAKIVAPPIQDTPTTSRREHNDAKRAEQEGWKNIEAQICAFCLCGGNILCCDICPASFHLPCIAIDEKEVPEGVWLCNRCQNTPSHLRTLTANAFTPSSSNSIVPPNPAIRAERERQRNEETFRFQVMQSDKTLKQTKWPGDSIIKAISCLNPTEFNLPADMLEMHKPLPFDNIDKAKKEVFNIKCCLCKTKNPYAPMLNCDFCQLVWHFDCLNPPLTVKPTWRLWMCPAHVENIIDESVGGRVMIESRRLKLWKNYTDNVKLNKKTMKTLWSQFIEMVSEERMKNLYRKMVFYQNSEPIITPYFQNQDKNKPSTSNEICIEDQELSNKITCVNQTFIPKAVTGGSFSKRSSRSKKTVKKNALSLSEVYNIRFDSKSKLIRRRNNEQVQEYDENDDNGIKEMLDKDYEKLDELDKKRSIPITDRELFLTIFSGNASRRKEHFENSLSEKTIENMATISKMNDTVMERNVLITDYSDEREIINKNWQALNIKKGVRGSSIESYHPKNRQKEEKGRRRIIADSDIQLVAHGYGNEQSTRRINSLVAEMFFSRCAPPLRANRQTSPTDLRHTVLTSQQGTIELGKAFITYPPPKNLENLVIFMFDHYFENEQQRNRFKVSSITSWSKENFHEILLNTQRIKRGTDESNKSTVCRYKFFAPSKDTNTNTNKEEDELSKNEADFEKVKKEEEKEEEEKKEKVEELVESSEESRESSVSVSDSIQTSQSAQSLPLMSVMVNNAERFRSASPSFCVNLSMDKKFEETEEDIMKHVHSAIEDTVNKVVFSMKDEGINSQTNNLNCENNRNYIQQNMKNEKEKEDSFSSKVVKNDKLQRSVNSQVCPKQITRSAEEENHIIQNTHTKRNSVSPQPQRIESSGPLTLQPESKPSTSIEDPLKNKELNGTKKWCFEAHPALRDHDYAKDIKMVRELSKLQNENYIRAGTISSAFCDAAGVMPIPLRGIQPMRKRGRPPGSKNKIKNVELAAAHTHNSHVNSSVKRKKKDLNEVLTHENGTPIKKKRGRPKGSINKTKKKKNGVVDKNSWSSDDECTVSDEKLTKIDIETRRKFKEKIEAIKNKYNGLMIKKLGELETQDYYRTRDYAIQNWTTLNWEELTSRCSTERYNSLIPFNPRFFLPEVKVLAIIELVAPPSGNLGSGLSLPFAIQRGLTKIGSASDCHIRVDHFASRTYCKAIQDYHCDIIFDRTSQILYLSTLARATAIVDDIVVFRKKLTPNEAALRTRLFDKTPTTTKFMCHCEDEVTKLSQIQKGESRRIENGIVALRNNSTIRIGCVDLKIKILGNR